MAKAIVVVIVHLQDCFCWLLLVIHCLYGARRFSSAAKEDGSLSSSPLPLFYPSPGFCLSATLAPSPQIELALSLYLSLFFNPSLQAYLAYDDPNNDPS
jgi:hypothetical protein